MFQLYFNLDFWRNHTDTKLDTKKRADKKMIRFLLLLFSFLFCAVNCDDGLLEIYKCKSKEASNRILLITPQESYLYDR